MKQNQSLEQVRKKLRLARNAGFLDKKKIHQEAALLLQEVIVLSDCKQTQAWSWFELARVRSWQGVSRELIEEAFLHATRLLPGESLFTSRYQSWKKDVYKGDFPYLPSSFRPVD